MNILMNFFFYFNCLTIDDEKNHDVNIELGIKMTENLKMYLFW